MRGCKSGSPRESNRSTRPWRQRCCSTRPPANAASLHNWEPGAGVPAGFSARTRWPSPSLAGRSDEIAGTTVKKTMSLFRRIPAEDQSGAPRPLADRMRPQTLEEFVGQEKLLAPGKPLRTQIERDEIGSMILWGPPGCGKTTLARIIAQMTRSDFISFSAVLSGIKEIKQVMGAAERARHEGRRTIIFIDEVHRFNKAQQDAFLPHVEAGNIILIGATTENPSFELIAPLLSRTKVYVLQPLASAQLVALLCRALADTERGLGREKIDVAEATLERVAWVANGDARAAYNTLEASVQGARPGADGRRAITTELVEDVLQRKLLLYDKAGEEHYNLISALHKSVRNSDADAAL